ncbi:hypothetical protein CGRA01v4_13290 [Colletotrichum graminicola]|nr:hypothetical protein CGRA01v4_13290 [Colletotrichum graminicola]
MKHEKGSIGRTISTRLGACLNPLPTIEALPHHRTAWNVCRTGTPEQAGRPSLRLEMDDSSRSKIFGSKDIGLRGPGISAFAIGHRAIVRPQKQALRDVYRPPRPLARRRLHLVPQVRPKVTVSSELNCLNQGQRSFWRGFVRYEAFNKCVSR